MNRIEKWSRVGGVLILGYQAFLISNQIDYLFNADLLICDEGHVLKNRETKLYEAVKMFKTTKRILLTGTPIQNNLQECKYWIHLI